MVNPQYYANCNDISAHLVKRHSGLWCFRGVYVLLIIKLMRSFIMKIINNSLNEITYVYIGLFSLMQKQGCEILFIRST